MSDYAAQYATNGGPYDTKTTSSNNPFTNGPSSATSAVKTQASKVSSSAIPPTAAGAVPAGPATQPLTHYHSLFSSLVAWENPRNSAIAYVAIIAFILAVRYLDVLRWGFKLTWIVLGISLAAEVAGKVVLHNGLTSQIRPKQYYTVPRETFDTVVGDLHELVNFFVIEAQRIFFAENVYVSAGAALAAFLSYFLVKVVPYWGLALIATTVAFIFPLIYTSNQELIDQQLKNASTAVQTHSAQFREVANKRAANYTALSKQYAANYSARAQEMIRNRGKAAPAATTATATGASVKASDFPAPPKEDLKSASGKTPLAA